MMICGQGIRLTAPERVLLTSMTGLDTANIRTKKALAVFVRTNIKKIKSCEPGAVMAYRLLINSLPCSDESCLKCANDCIKYKILSASNG